MIGKADKRDFEAFVRRSSDRLVRTAYLLCADRGHSQDLVQTALVRTARHWREARRNPEAYTRQVLVNLVTDGWRYKARRPSELSLDRLPGTPIAPDGADAWLDRHELLQAAAALPAGQRAVLVLRFFDDLSVEETAAALSITTGTVKSQTTRAISALRSALGEPGADPITPLTPKEIPC